MKTSSQTSTPCLRVAAMIAVMATGGTLALQPAFADICMQDRFQLETGTTKSLKCSSSDVTIGVAEDPNITPVKGVLYQGDSLYCVQDSEIEFTADFIVSLGTSARYDLGLYLAPGQTQALTGSCSSDIITPDNNVSGNFRQLDYYIPGQVDDVCGDIEGAFGGTEYPFNPQIVRLNIAGTCTPNQDGSLALPYCISWRTPGSNDLCEGIADAYPASGSKCNCDDNLALPIEPRPQATHLDVVKTADPTVSQPGGVVDYTVEITNPAVVESVDLKLLTEDDNNDGAVDVSWDESTLGAICDRVVLEPCGLDPGNCPDEATATCIFPRVIDGIVGTNIEDKACATGAINGGQIIDGCGTATVAIEGVGPAATLKKEVLEATCATVKYQVTVENLGTESATLTALEDDQFGDITLLGDTTCVVPQSLAAAGQAGDEYVCTFTAELCQGDLPHDNEVTGTVSDGVNPDANPKGSVRVIGVNVESGPVPTP